MSQLACLGRATCAVDSRVSISVKIEGINNLAVTGVGPDRTVLVWTAACLLDTLGGERQVNKEETFRSFC